MKVFRIFLVFLLMLALFSGCGTIDRAEDAIENRVDAAEDAIEQTINDAANALLNPNPNATEPAVSYTPVDPSQLIPMEQAQNIALEHAGLTAEDVVGLHTILQIDDGRQEYEVQFHSGHLEYEYEIDAATGAILSFETDD